MDFVGMLIDEKEWIFSGVGVYILGIVGAILVLIARRIVRKQRCKSDSSYTKPSLTITTHGKQSPGVVGRDYIVGTRDGKNHD